MIGTIALWFIETAIGRMAASALIVATVFSGWLVMHDRKVAHKAVNGVVLASKEAGKQANAKNDRVRRDAGKPGAAERLRKNACRDC